MTRDRAIYFISVVILFILSSFRGRGVGTDTENYIGQFDAISSGVNFLVEPGWLYLNKLVAASGLGYRGMIVASSAIILCLTGLSIYKLRERLNINLALFLFFSLYFYFYSLNITRQMLAVSIVLFSYVYFFESSKNKNFLGYFSLLIACTFHVSAFVSVIGVAFSKIRYNFLIYLFLVLVSIPSGVILGEYIFSLASEFGYEHYVDRLHLKSSLGNLAFSLLTSIFFLFMVFVFGGRRNQEWCSLIVSFLFFSNIVLWLPYSNRLTLYLMIFAIAALPILVYSTRNGALRIFGTILVLFYGVATFIMKAGAGGVVPYTNVLLG